MQGSVGRARSCSSIFALALLFGLPNQFLKTQDKYSLTESSFFSHWMARKYDICQTLVGVFMALSHENRKFSFSLFVSI